MRFRVGTVYMFLSPDLRLTAYVRRLPHNRASVYYPHNNTRYTNNLNLQKQLKRGCLARKATPTEIMSLKLKGVCP
jgi:hypothetical protein